MKLANVFKVPYSDILNSEASSKFADSAVECHRDSPIGKEGISYDGLSYEEKCLIVAFRLLSEDDRKNMLSSMVKEFKADSEPTDL